VSKNTFGNALLQSSLDSRNQQTLVTADFFQIIVDESFDLSVGAGCDCCQIVVHVVGHDSQSRLPAVLLLM
jgi:ribose/xylose/arabinose/galactoside ABC-type transport system permease subunit